jgi:hypothetical protein
MSPNFGGGIYICTNSVAVYTYVHIHTYQNKATKIYQERKNKTLFFTGINCTMNDSTSTPHLEV